MAKLLALLNLGSVSASLFNYGIRIHGNTAINFGPLIALNDRTINKNITMLSAATLEFLDTGSIKAGNSAWNSVRILEGAINRLPGNKRDITIFHLERYVQMLLARDDELAKLIGDDIKNFRNFRIQKMEELRKRPSAAAAIIARWRTSILTEGGDILRILKHFDEVKPQDSPAIDKAGAYIRDNFDSIKKAVQAAKVGNNAALLGHLSNVRGYLGEAYALLSPIWREKHWSELQSAKALARKMGSDYEVLSLSQLENNIHLSGKEGADQMIVIINSKRNEAYTFLSAQVKTADVSEAVDQIINDVINRELNPKGLLEFEYQKKFYALSLAQHELVSAQRYILNSAESRIPGPHLQLLKKYGILVTEITLDMSVSQFSLLSIKMIEEGLNALKKTRIPP